MLGATFKCLVKISVLTLPLCKVKNVNSYIPQKDGFGKFQYLLKPWKILTLLLNTVLGKQALATWSCVCTCLGWIWPQLLEQMPAISISQRAALFPGVKNNNLGPLSFWEQFCFLLLGWGLPAAWNNRWINPLFSQTSINMVLCKLRQASVILFNVDHMVKIFLMAKSIRILFQQKQWLCGSHRLQEPWVAYSGLLFHTQTWNMVYLCAEIYRILQDSPLAAFFPRSPGAVSGWNDCFDGYDSMLLAYIFGEKIERISSFHNCPGQPICRCQTNEAFLRKFPSILQMHWQSWYCVNPHPIFDQLKYCSTDLL